MKVTYRRIPRSTAIKRGITDITNHITPNVKEAILGIGGGLLGYAFLVATLYVAG